MVKSKNKKEIEELIWLALPGFVLLGMGLGFLFGNLPAGLFSGIGIGFLSVLTLGLKYLK